MATLIQELGEAIRDKLRANATLITILGQTNSVTNLEYADQPLTVNPNYGGAATLRFENIVTPPEFDYEDSARSTFTYSLTVVLQDLAGTGAHLGLCASAIRSVFLDKGKTTIDAVTHTDKIGSGTITTLIDADPLEALTDRDKPIVLATIAVTMGHDMPLTV